MSERDDDTKNVPPVSEQDARAIDAGVRELRNAPIGAERMARMRAGLDARIAAAAAEGEAPAPVTPISSHPRWQRWAVPAAAALAAAVLLALLLSQGEPRPIEVADDGAPAPVQPTPESPLEVVPETQVAEAPAPVPVPVPVPETDVADAPVPGPMPETQVADAPAPTPPAGALDAASDEELAVAFEYDRLADYDVIAQLELLELLDVLEAEGSI